MSDKTCTIEATLDNSFNLEVIASTLHEEAKTAQPGYQFKKLVPAMSFYCFALESKLISYGKEVFTNPKQYKQYMNATILGKFDWLFSRMELDVDPAELNPHREVIEHMVHFRNSVVHSKTITFEEERELIGFEQFSSKYIEPPKHEKDFMAQRSIEACDSYERTIDFTTRAWAYQSKKYFNDGNFYRGCGFSNVRRLNLSLDTTSVDTYAESLRLMEESIRGVSIQVKLITALNHFNNESSLNNSQPIECKVFL